MKVKTVVTERFRKPSVKDDKFLAALLFGANVFTTAILPFMFGFYFYMTRSLWFVALFVVITYVNIELHRDKHYMEIRFKRLF